MHSGRWTPEEEQYVEGMIAEFNAGLLPIAEGTTLRSFLAKMLNCNPKRVSKKYDGNPIYNGKAAYVRAKNPLPPAEAAGRQENLLELERKFREALCTMQRVESRLQSLTSHLMPPDKKAKTSNCNEEPATEDPWRSSSAVSSLTEDDPEGAASDQDMKIEPCKVEESLTFVTQVSDQTMEAKRAPLSPHTASEEAAGQMLLQLNASRPPATATTNVMPSAKQATVPVDYCSKQSFQHVPAPATAVSNYCNSLGNQIQVAASSPAVPVQNSSGNGELQGLLQKLAQMRQQPCNQQPAPSPVSGLQNMLSMPARLESPISQPQTAQQNLHMLVQSLVEQQQQQMPPPTPQGLDLPSILQSLTQEQPKPKPEADLQNLLGSLMQSNGVLPISTNNHGVQQSAQLKQDGNAVLGTALRQIIGGGNSAVAPPPPPPPPQPSVGSLLQSFLQQQQQQQQRPQQQPPTQNQGVQAALANLVDQLQQSQQQQALGTPPPPPSSQNVLQGMLSAPSLRQQQQQQSQQPPPAPKPPQAQSTANSQSKTLQQLLMELQQTQADASKRRQHQV